MFNYNEMYTGQEDETVAAEQPRDPYPKKNVLTLDVQFDSQSVKKGITFSKRTKGGFKKKKDPYMIQAVHPNEEKNHHSCIENVPVFTVCDSDDYTKMRYGYQLKALQTLNGKIFDTRKINDELDLLKYTKWFGLGFEQYISKKRKYLMLNEKYEFSTIYFGEQSVMNYTFSWPIKNKHGLIHKESCKPMSCGYGDVLTFGFLPFDFSVKKKIEQKKWSELGGTSELELQKNKYLTDATLYSPGEEDWYQHWYRHYPEEQRRSERLVPVFYKMYNKYDLWGKESQKKLYYMFAKEGVSGMADEIVKKMSTKPQGITQTQFAEKIIHKKLKENASKALHNQCIKYEFIKMNPMIGYMRVLSKSASFGEQMKVVISLTNKI